MSLSQTAASSFPSVFASRLRRYFPGPDVPTPFLPPRPFYSHSLYPRLPYPYPSHRRPPYTRLSITTAPAPAPPTLTACTLTRSLPVCCRHSGLIENRRHDSAIRTVHRRNEGAVAFPCQVDGWRLPCPAAPPPPLRSPGPLLSPSPFFLPSIPCGGQRMSASKMPSTTGATAARASSPEGRHVQEGTAITSKRRRPGCRFEGGVAHRTVLP